MAPWLLPSEANQAAFDKLVTALTDGTAVALVGAGSSARVGYPLWGSLLDRMAHMLVESHPRARDIVDALASENDLVWKAEELRRLFGDDAYHHFVRTTFGPEEAAFDAFHEDLVRLPFRHVLTTNYDAVLEQAHASVFQSRPFAFAWNESANMRELIQRIGDENYGRRYVYLHGRFDEPEETILTERDYLSRFVVSADTLPKLFALLATQRVVSVGFSLSDMDVMGVFRQVHGHMGAGETRHFAILPLDPRQDEGLVRRRLGGKFGVEPIFYRADPTHEGLPAVVRELLRNVRPSLNIPLPGSEPQFRPHSEPLPPTAGYDQRCYVARPDLERHVEAAIASPGTPVVLLGPSRFGKTALLRHVVERACREDHAAGRQSRAVHIALDTFALSRTTPLDDFLYELGCHMVSGVDGDKGWLEEVWDLSGSGLTRMEALMRRHVLNTVNGRLILTLEGLEELHKTSFSSSFLGMLRAWAQNASHPAWGRLRLAITVSTEPSLFKEEIHRSAFFNAALLIRLPDLRRNEVEALRDIYGLAWTRKECDSLMDLVGGHPYLLRAAMFEAAQHGTNLSAILAGSHLPGGIFEPFLSRLYHEVRSELLDVIFKILGDPGTRLSVEVEDRLRGAGLLRGGPGAYRLRYALYESYLRDVCNARR